MPEPYLYSLCTTDKDGRLRAPDPKEMTEELANLLFWLHQYEGTANNNGEVRNALIKFDWLSSTATLQEAPHNRGSSDRDPIVLDQRHPKSTCIDPRLLSYCTSRRDE